MIIFKTHLLLVGKRVLRTKLSYGAPRRARNPRCGYVVYLHHNVTAKVAVNRPAAVMHSRAGAQQTGKPTTAIIAAYHFRFERKLSEEERALRHARLANERVGSLETQ